MKEPGQAGWEKYMEGYGAFWSEQPDFVRREWAAVERAVLDAQPCEHPWDCVDLLDQDSIIYKCSKCQKEL